MSHDRLASTVPNGEALRYTTAVRTGGSLGLTDERLLLARDEVVSVKLTDVQEVTVQTVDWFLVVLGLALFGFGLFYVQQNPLGGAFFSAAAVASLFVTYRKRGRVDVTVHSRAKPLRFYLEDTEAFERAYRDRVIEAEAELEPS